jgi:hypothetical protein
VSIWNAIPIQVSRFCKTAHGVTISAVAAITGGSNSVVECQLPKLDVAGSIPVSRSMFLSARVPFATVVYRDDAHLLCSHECNHAGTSSAAGPRWTSSKYKALAGSVSPRKIVRAGCGFCLSMATKLATGCTDPDVPMAINSSHPFSAS